MSRNSRRTKVQQAPKQAPQPNPPSHLSDKSNPFGISFVVPTHIVELPSAGKYYDPESTLFGKDKLEIKQMTAKQEEILSNADYLVDGTMLDRLVNSILTDKSINVEELLSGDKNALVLEARRTSYGSEYSVNQVCENCKNTEAFIYDLSKVSIKNDLPEGVTYSEATRLFSFNLPSTGLPVSIRMMTATDERFLKEQNDKANKLNIENSETINFLRRCVASVSGVSDQKLLNDLFGVLPVLDIRKIKKVSNGIIPTLETKQEITCGGCGHVTESEVPFSLGFFWPDV
tara:strand:+ start:2905 stop:3768 length:864 start_codon:yes stop_codon:yes gene_type:complete